MTTIISKSGIGVPLPEKLETAELAVDTTNGNLYTKLDDGSVAHLNDVGQGGGGTGSSVHIGDTPPADPQEGQQWMEVPADGDATMWIYDGGKWLQQPGGKDGAPGQNGADGNIQDATEQGVVATWDDSAKQWTPDSSLAIDSSGKATFSSHLEFAGGAGFLYRPDDGVVTLKTEADNRDSSRTRYFDFADNGANEQLIRGTVDKLRIGAGADARTTGLAIDASGDATFSGSVNTFGDLIASGSPAGGYFTASGNFAGESAAAGMVMVRPSQKVNNFITCTNGGHGGVPVFSVGPTGNTRAGGQLLLGTRDLIETLSTLRNATKDETTIKGLRDAIGNAVGGLIEKFEAMQSTATQEISDE